MTLILSGTDGLSDVDGSAATPAIRGTDANTGIFFGADIIGFAEGGAEVARFNADAQFVAAAGTASLPVITTTGDTNTGIFFPAADTIAFSEGGVEAMRLDSAGNMGLGVTPSANSLAGSGYRNLEIGSVNGYGLFAGSYEIYMLGNAYYNSGWKYANSSKLASRYIQTDGIHAWFNAPSGTAGNTITFTQAMTLDASGNLLVGLTSSSSRLHVDGGDANISRTSANSRLLVTATGVANTAIGFNNSGSTATGMPNNVGYVNVLQAYPLVFGTDSTERARITSGGDLLVGVQSNFYGERLTIVQPTSGKNTSVQRNTTASTPYGGLTEFSAVSPNNTTSYFFQASDSTTTCFTIWSNGTTSGRSDVRLKKNITSANSQLADVMAIEVVNYEWNESESGSKEIGYIAQQVQEVKPSLVQEDEKGFLHVKQTPLVAILWKAVQEQQALITQLQADVAALKGTA